MAFQLQSAWEEKRRLVTQQEPRSKQNKKQKRWKRKNRRKLNRFKNTPGPWLRIEQRGWQLATGHLIAATGVEMFGSPIVSVPGKSEVERGSGEEKVYPRPL